MHAPIIWIRRRPARRLIHRFPGTAGETQSFTVATTEDTDAEADERQAARLRDRGAADLEALDSRRAAWIEPGANGEEAHP